MCAERSAEGAFFRICTEPFELVVFDHPLPGKSAFEILGALRKHRSSLPSYVVADSEVLSRPDLHLADDYLVKPFSGSEAIEQMKKCVIETKRACRGKGTMELNAELRPVNVAGRIIDVLPIEIRLLRTLLDRRAAPR